MDGYVITYDENKYEFLNGRLHKKDVTIEMIEDLNKPEIRRKAAEEARAKYIEGLLNKRILTKSYSTITELIIIEISKTAEYVKVQDIHGKKEWKQSSFLEVVEILGDYKPRVSNK